MRPYIALLLAVAIWGTNFHVVKLATDSLPFFIYLALRFWIASAAYYLFYFTRKLAAGNRLLIGAREHTQGRFRGLSNSSAVIVGVCLSLFYSLQTQSISKDAVNAAFFTATFVFWVPIISLVLGIAKTISRSVFAGIIITLIGIVLLERFNPANVSAHDIIGFAGAFALAVEVVILGEVAKGANSLRLLLWTAKYTLFVAIIFTIAVVISGELYTFRGFDRQAVAALLFTGVAATAFANFLANWANSVCDSNGKQILTSTHRAILENLDAPIALLVACAVPAIGKSYSWHDFAGCFLIICGVLIAELDITKRFSTAGNSPTQE